MTKKLAKVTLIAACVIVAIFFELYVWEVKLW